MSVLPVTDYSFNNPVKAPYLEYDIFFFTTGEFTVDSIFSPGHSVIPDRGLRYAIGFGKEDPQVINLMENFDQNTWGKMVSNDAHHSHSRHKISRAGLHKLRIYMIDPGVSLQKIIIDTGGLKPSYLGPQQSLKID